MVAVAAVITVAVAAAINVAVAAAIPVAIVVAAHVASRCFHVSEICRNPGQRNLRATSVLSVSPW